MKVARFGMGLLLLAMLCSASLLASEKSTRMGFDAIKKNELLLPSNYRNWVALAPKALGMPKHSNKRVVSKLYVDPSSYEQFAKTGSWPNKTVIVMELLTNKAPVKGQCNVMGLEAAVKDGASFADPWTYYGIVYSREKEQQTVEPIACVDCDNPADSMLTMAFPTLRAVINAKPGHVTPSLF